MRSNLVFFFLWSLLCTFSWSQEILGRAGVLTAPVLSNPSKSSLTTKPSTTTKPPASTKTSAKPSITLILAKPTTTTSSKTSVKPSTTIKTSAKPSTTTTSAKPSITKSVGPVVTDAAYIDTVIRHHNVHRSNHSANAISWSASLAQTAAKIAASCVFQHDTKTDGGGYGQNIGAGYPSTNMGQFITGGLYNGEVNAYTYFGGEPNLDTLGQWGHFSQIVWKGTTAVGCYTYDCTKTGLGNTGGGNIPPYFTVCNYSPPGNYVGEFKSNVGVSLHHPTVDGSYGCGSAVNCANSGSTA